MTMEQSVDDLYRFGLKLFVEPASSLDGDCCIPIFHRWIQTSALNRLLIDVVDYTHLVSGPRVLLVGHEGNLSVDQADGRAGIVCTSKRPAISGSLPERIVDVARVLFVAARLLELDTSFDRQLKFVPNELQFQANDRLLAPTGDDSNAALKLPLQMVMETLYPDQFHQMHNSHNSTTRVKINLKTPEPVSLDSLLERIGSTVTNA
jgi:hypothetical protein